jgi:hypothetical protein
VLAGPSARSGELATLPGVRSCTGDPTGARLVVDAAHLDAVLVAAVAAGWSVRTVGPA